MYLVGTIKTYGWPDCQRTSLRQTVDFSTANVKKHQAKQMIALTQSLGTHLIFHMHLETRHSFQKSRVKTGDTVWPPQAELHPEISQSFGLQAAKTGPHKTVRGSIHEIPTQQQCSMLTCTVVQMAQVLWDEAFHDIMPMRKGLASKTSRCLMG